MICNFVVNPDYKQSNSHSRPSSFDASCMKPSALYTSSSTFYETSKQYFYYLVSDLDQYELHQFDSSKVYSNHHFQREIPDPKQESCFLN